MEYCYYELDTAPDFSLDRYSSLSETGPSGVLTQHQSFWRQLNQWGKMFNGGIHFIYQFDAGQPVGKRMKLIIRFDAADPEAKTSIQQIMKASILAPYYDQLNLKKEDPISSQAFGWKVNLIKKERFIPSLFNEKEAFYIVSDWEMNPNARLYSMLRIMAASGSSCAYCVDIYPVDYNNALENGLRFILPHLRELDSFKIKTDLSSVSGGGKDENAKKALDFYENLTDSLAVSPHFLVNVQAFGKTETVARQILDAAASEALTGGNYSLYGEKSGSSVCDTISSGFSYWNDPEAPEGLATLPHLMTLEEMVPFAVMPVLYPGESIEMPKETVPEIQDGMFIGRDGQGHGISFPWENLSKHIFLAGMPGSGKTNAMMYLIAEIHREGIPFLMFEPAKKEYRSLVVQPDMEDIFFFSPCAGSMFPIHINPFEFPHGMRLSDHINRLLDIFNGTFLLDPPMPMLLAEGIQICYEKLLWLPGMVNQGNLRYPTLSMLYPQIEELMDKYQYADDVRNNLQSILQVRIGSLMSREMGDIFDVGWSTFPPEQWLEKSAVIELAALGTAPSNFMILTLMTSIRESLDIQIYEPEKYEHRPRHMIFLEEAHNLIANTSIQKPGEIDPKVSATAYITKMLAEVRALGEGIVIADQLPTSMAPEVIKNTSLKFGLRLTSQDERELLGAAMSADILQLENMGVFMPGHCLVSYEGLLKPFEIQIPEYKNDDVVNDVQILREKLCDPVYHHSMLQSVKIMEMKYTEKRDHLRRKTVQFYDKLDRTRSYIKKYGEDLIQEDLGGALISPVIEEWHEIKYMYSNLVGQWHRLTLDIMMYSGTIVICKWLIINWDDIYFDDEKWDTNTTHDECYCIIGKLLDSIKKEWGTLERYGKACGLKDENGQKVRFMKRKEIIMAGWKNVKDIIK